MAAGPHEAAVVTPDPASLACEEGLGGALAPPQPASGGLARPPVRRAASVAFAAAAALLLASAALALSVHHSCNVGLRVDSLHASAPEGADSATLLFDALVERPEWNPHTAVVRSATCQLQYRGVDSLVEVPEIHGASRVSFPAHVRMTPAGFVAPAPECRVAFGVDLFGSGLIVPWQVRKPLKAWAPLRAKTWIRRTGELKRSWPSPSKGGNLTLEQAALLSVQVPARSVPESLRGLLDSAKISLEAAVTYEESEDKSVRLTKTVNASLNAEGDGNGGYLVSVPITMSGNVRPVAFAGMLGKLLVGRSPTASVLLGRVNGAKPQHGSVDRAVRLVAEQPLSPAAQCLGAERTFGWRNHRKSATNDLVRGVQRRLGRRLARSLVGAKGGQNVDMPLPWTGTTSPWGRRLSESESSLITETTIKETLYMDDDQVDVDIAMTMSDEMMSVDMDYCMTVDGEEQMRVRLVASEDADEYDLSFILNLDGMEPVNIRIMPDSEDEMSLALMLKDMESGITMADVDLSESSASVHIYNTDAGEGSAAEWLTIEASNSDTSMSFSMTLKEQGETSVGDTLATATASATYTGDDVDLEFSVMTYATDDESTGMTLSGTYDVEGTDTDTTSMSFQMTATESGEDGKTYVEMAASGTNTGDDYAVTLTATVEGGLEVTVSGTETSESDTTSMALSVIVNVTAEEEDEEDETFVNVSASATNSGDDYEMDFTAKVSELEVTGAIVDQYGTEDGLTVDVEVSNDGEVMMKVDVDGTHDDERVDAVAKLLDGDSAELVKLDPLSFTYMSTLYSVHATLFADDDSTLTEMITVGLELTTENEVNFDMFSNPGDMDIHMNVSFAEGWRSWTSMEGMEEVPCIQGSCSMNLSHQGSSMEVNFSSSDSDGQVDYAVMNVATMEDTLFEESFSLTTGGVTWIDYGIQMASTASADQFDIEEDEVDLMSTGTVKDSESEEVVLSWDVAVHESSSSQTVAVAVNGSDDESIIKVNITMSESDTTMQSTGEIDANSERIVKWSFMEEQVGSTTTVNGSIYNSDGLMGTAEVEIVDESDSNGMLAISANVSTSDGEISDDAVEPLFGIAYEMADSDGTMTQSSNISINMEDGYMPFGGFWLQTMDVTDTMDRVSAELKLFHGEELDQFVHGLAGIDFTSSNSERLISDFEADVTVQIFNPENQEFVMQMNASATSSGGVLMIGMGMHDADMVEQMSMEMSGTSASTGIELSQSIDDMNATITLSLTKPDGRMDTMTEMETDITLEMDTVVANLNMAYEGSDIWNMGVTVTDNGESMIEVEGQTNGEWFAMMSWANEDTMEVVGQQDTIGTGFVYEWLNISLVPVQISDDIESMWEMNYIKTGDYIESTNMSHNTSGSSDEESFSVSSYVMYKENNEWHYSQESDISSVTIDTASVTVETVTTSSFFQTTVTAAEAETFVNDPVVKQSFVTSIAERIGLPESTVEVTLSVVSSEDIRSTATVQVDYTITAQVAEVSTGAGVIGEAEFEALVAELQETSAEEFVADFLEELEEADSTAASSYSVVAVADSAADAEVDRATPAPTPAPTAAPGGGSASAADGPAMPSLALLLAGVGGLLL